MKNKDIENTDEFIKYINNNKIKKIFTGTLWAEGPAFIPHLNKLVWSDIPNNRMLQLINGKVAEFKNPSKSPLKSVSFITLTISLCILSTSLRPILCISCGVRSVVV